MESHESMPHHNERSPAGHPQTGPDVAVTVDGEEKIVHRGSHRVSEFKAEVGVSADRELVQVIDGELTPLDDSHRITIKGGEVFFSRVRSGGSSR